MVVRNTEKYIPGGIANAAALGYARIGEDNRFALVSVLDQCLHIDLSGPAIVNSYTLFIDHLIAADFTYDWSVVFYTAEQTVGGFQITDTENGYLDLSLSKLKEITAVRDIIRMEVTVQAKNNGIEALSPISLDHNIKIFDSNFPPPRIVSGDRNIAKMGSPVVTQFIKRNLSNFIPGADATNLVPLNITLAIIYHYLLHTLSSIGPDMNYFRNYRWEDIINLEQTPGNTDYLRTGICRLKPHLTASFFSDNPSATNDPLLEFCYIDENTNESVLINGFNALPVEKKACLYNMLRFPKSCINLCYALLHKLAEQHKQDNDALWGDLTLEEVNENPVWAETIVTELDVGVHRDLPAKDISRESKKIFNIAWTPYMIDIMESLQSDVPFRYEVVRIKLVDIRSGRPIEKARVKQIILLPEDDCASYLPLSYNFENYYSYNLDNNYGLLRRAKNALSSFGYACGNNEANFNNIEIAAFNRYKNDRFLREIPDVPPGNNPPENLLRYVYDEFANHLESDENGVLNILIPIAYMENRKLKMQIGFFEFPIILEDEHLITRPDIDIKPTNFQINWVGEEGGNNAQSVDWQENINGRHFGWHVACCGSTTETFLKVCLEIELKTDTGPFTGINGPQLSHFQDDIYYPYHFTIFGMVWSQPVWAPLPPTATHRIRGKVDPGTGTTEGTFEPIPGDAVNLPVMVTNWRSGGGSGGGRDYGMLIPRGTNDVFPNPINAHDSSQVTLQSYPPRIPPRGNRPHHGIDYYGIEGQSPAFVPNGGVVAVYSTTSNGYGITLIIRNRHDQRFRLAHLFNNHRNADIVVNAIVPAGLFVGYVGRTFTGGSNAGRHNYPVHLHLEICRGSYTVRFANPLSIFINDDVNSNLFLNNNSHRLFPCDCEGRGGDNQDEGKSCSIRLIANRPSISNIVYRDCWAFRNLHCPYIRSDYGADHNRVARIKAQLLFIFLHIQDNEQYLHPGTGVNWDQAAQQAIERFRVINNIQVGNMTAEPVAGDATMNRLDDLCRLFNGNPNQLTVKQKLLMLFNNNNYKSPIPQPPHSEDPNLWGLNVQYAIRNFRVRNNVDINLADLTGEPADNSDTLNELNNLSPYPRTSFNIEEK